MGVCDYLLIIDNEEHTRETLALIFRNAGYSVITAPTGAEALKDLTNHSILLIFLDLYVPDMDIYTLLQNIRRQNSQVPMIIFTAYDKPELALMAEALNVNEYLVKPVDPEVIVEKARKIIDLVQIASLRIDQQMLV